MPVAFSKRFSCCLTGIGIGDPEKFSKHRAMIEKFDKSGRLNEDSKLVLLAAQIAIENAQINLKYFDKTKIGIVLATMFGSFGSYENFYKNLKLGNLQPQEFVASLASTPASAISIFFKLKGPSITFSGISFPLLIDTAKILIENQICEIVFVGCLVIPSVTLISYAEINISPFSVVVIVESIKIAKKRNCMPLLVI